MKNSRILEMALGDRMKYYESCYETNVKPEQHIICRIDGHKFSKFSKGFKKPFDDILSEAFRLTAQDLLAEFNAYTVYQQSDEITLVIPSLMNTEKHKDENTPTWTHGYSGRVQKMASLIAGFTTMRFNKHLNDEANRYYDNNIVSYTDEVDREYIQNIFSNKVGNAWFDCRIYGVDSDEEAFNSVMWRVRDCVKNSTSMFAQAYVSHKQLQNLNGKEQIELCKEETGKDWNNIEDRYKYGILVKKELYSKLLDGKEKERAIEFNQPTETTRSRIISFSEELTTFSDESVKMVMAKYK